MSSATSASVSSRRYWPVVQIMLMRLREFYREPDAVIWVYGFPILLIVSLGLAFRNGPGARISIDIEASPQAPIIQETLAAYKTFTVAIREADQCRKRLRTGKSDLVVILPSPVLAEPPRYEYQFDSARPESVLARKLVDDVLQRSAGRRDPINVADRVFDEPGGRYVDFLVPGLLGMGLMSGGLWGVGFVTVDMRIRKLLKRFLATPMKKRDFLAGIMLSRLLIMLPEMLVLLLFAWLTFGVTILGSPLAVLAIILLGAGTFAGVGLLVAARARTIEAVSGLMNLVMLPMSVCSGVFFSSDRFPEGVRPVIKALPLTLLIDALRGVMQEGASLASQLPEIAGLTAWGVISFALALRLFRWV